MELVRSDQFQGFLSNPDQLGRNRTVYVYETAAAPRAVAASTSSSSGDGPLMVLLAVGGAIVAAGAALVSLGAQLEEQPSFQRIRGRGRPARRHRPRATSRPEGPRLAPWVRRGLVGLVALVLVLALFGFVGQSTSTTRAETAAATLAVDAPDAVRGGLLYQTRFTIVAHQELAARDAGAERELDRRPDGEHDRAEPGQRGEPRRRSRPRARPPGSGRQVRPLHGLPGEPDHGRLAHARSSSSTTASSPSPP